MCLLQHVDHCSSWRPLPGCVLLGPVLLQRLQGPAGESAVGLPAWHAAAGARQGHLRPAQPSPAALRCAAVKAELMRLCARPEKGAAALGLPPLCAGSSRRRSPVLSTLLHVSVLPHGHDCRAVVALCCHQAACAQQQELLRQVLVSPVGRPPCMRLLQVTVQSMSALPKHASACHCSSGMPTWLQDSSCQSNTLQGLILCWCCCVLTPAVPGCGSQSR